MIGYGLDRGGPKDSETAPNSFLTKINGNVFWLFAPDMDRIFHSRQFGTQWECVWLLSHTQEAGNIVIFYPISALFHRLADFQKL